jgi:hypothetical protein
MNEEARAKWVAQPVLDVAFLLQESLYYGPDNDFSEEQWNALRDPLCRPRLPMYGRGKVLLRDAMADRVQLLRYYASVLQTAATRGKVLSPGAPEFWLRVVVLSGGEELISCAWHDTLEEALSILDALVRPGDGELFHDIDQGWELRVRAVGSQVIVRESDPDTGSVHACFRCDRSALAMQAQIARHELQEIITWLTSELGRNYWSCKGHPT